MPKMNVAFALDAQELERFDRWRGGLARGLALSKLLDLAERGGPVVRGTEYFQERAELGTARAAEPDVGPSRLDLARKVLERAEAGENAGAFDVGKGPTPQILKKREVPKPEDESQDPEDY
jgi:hypothetical protein